MTETVFTNSHAIKLFSKGEIRRFSFAGNTLQQLRDEVKTLLKISNEFVAKYEDDEGDFVTIGTDSELKYAFELAGSRPLRLKIVQKAINPESTTENVAGDVPRAVVAMDAKEDSWKDLKKEAKMQKLQFKQAKHQWKNEMKAAKKEMKQEKALYGARFVKHVTIEDGYEFAPSTPFVKTWRFRNEGTVAWPENAVLLRVGKKCDQLGATSDSVALGKSVLPGEEIDVSVPMVAPSFSGTHTGFWKLADPSGRKFGPRVRVQIKVVDSSSSEEDVTHKKFRFLTDDQTSYGDLLTQLESMGFTNKALNLRLLMRTNGNLDKVVRKLLKRQQKMRNTDKP